MVRLKEPETRAVKTRGLLPEVFDTVKISVASPEDILSWSYGEVTKPETINYRTQKPERDGLFDERIFGPTKDYECYCGKYKKIRYKGVVCDRCGVEVTRASVRRERMGHIDLAVPVAHIWYLHGVPSVLSTILDITVSALESIIYFASFIVTAVNEDIRKESLERLEREYQTLKNKPEVKGNPIILQKVEANYKHHRNELESLQKKIVLSERRFRELSLSYGQIVQVGIGAEAIYALLKEMDLNETIGKIEDELKLHPEVSRKRLVRRWRVLKDLKKANVKPEWLILTRLPVIPPDLRPMVQLDGGRFATSDLNDLYRRVLNRNNRLKRLMRQGAPEVILRNEKRMLQEAVDALIDNSARRGRAATIGVGKKLRSLSDILRGKQGRFRQNLLGKRVDYSGRSVIVIGPDLKLDQCGLPKIMALELFKTFVISKLISEGHVHNVKNATRMIEKKEPIVWDILERITSHYYVLLNRAPTLHRLGIQAFKPVLIEGKAIQIHPLVCYAFNADFDGDQMAVHVPLSLQARWEAKELMLSSKNLLKPASGEPVVSPRLDIVLGCYYLTSPLTKKEQKSKIFTSKNEAIMAYQENEISVRTLIWVKVKDEVSESDLEVKALRGSQRLIQTTVGRILFNNLLPDDEPFINLTMDAKRLKQLVTRVFKEKGEGETASLVDKIKDLGFEYAGLSGITISVEDIPIPETKEKVIKETEAKIEEVETQFRRGLITAEERKTKVIELWTLARAKIEKAMIEDFDEENPIWLTVSSGARGSVSQILQLSGMKGLVVNPAGEIIELPVKANFKEGLSVLEYFISTHGSRKGKSDTSLRTSDAGYLTRRLVDVAQDMVVTEKDCGSKRSIKLKETQSQEMGETFEERLVGRVAFKTLKHQGKTLIKTNQEIREREAKAIKRAAIEEVEVRSVLTCEAERGVCAYCYGRDLASGRMVKVGETVGIIAAQAIGEPGTQLTMKTFHLGGVLGEDITSGLPRVEELFEARTPRTPALVSEIKGEVSLSRTKGGWLVTVTSSKKQEGEINIPPGFEITVKTGDLVKARQAVAVAPNKRPLRSPFGGKIRVVGGKVKIESQAPQSVEYQVPGFMSLRVEPGEEVLPGQPLTEGHHNLSDSLKLLGEIPTQEYILKEVKEIYSSQGQAINDKHIEIIIRQMFSKVKVLDEGDSSFIPGQIVGRLYVEKLNEHLKTHKKKEIVYQLLVLGITRVALKTESFLSAASFQETTNILIETATKGVIDNLLGLKENVIIGKLIPAGTGIREFKEKELKEIAKLTEGEGPPATQRKSMT